MAFVTAFVDVQDSTGVSLVVPDPDGTRPALAFKLGSGLTGVFSKNGDTGVVTLTGSASSPSGVTPGTYGDGTHIPTFTVQADGRITAANSTAINLTLAGDVTGAIGSNALATTGVSPGTYGDASHWPAITIDAKGRVTAASQVSPTSATYTELSPVDLVPHEITGTPQLASAATTTEFMPAALVNFTDPMDTSSRFTVESEAANATTPTLTGGHVTIAAVAASNTILYENTAPQLTVPQFAAAMHITSASFVGFGNAGIGFAIDANNFVLAVWEVNSGNIAIQVKIGGSSAFHGTTANAVSAPFTLGISQVSNNIVAWIKPNGGNWTPICSYAMAGDYDFRTQLLSGPPVWKPVATWVVGTSGTLVFDSLTVGAFGHFGFRDPVPVTDRAGNPQMSGSVVTLTGTASDSSGAAYCGVFTLDLAPPHALTQTGVIFVNRSSHLYNDAACHIVKDGSGGFDTFITTWGTPSPAASVQVLYKNTSQTLTTAGTYILTSMTQQSLNGIPASGGAYDPFMVQIGGTFYLAWTAGPVAANTFYPVLNSTTNLASNSWTLVGQDTTAVTYEGTKIALLGGNYYVVCSSLSDGQVYDLTMTYQGKYANLVVSGTNSHAPHIALVPYQNRTYQITCDNTGASTTAGVDGHLRLFAARRYGVP